MTLQLALNLEGIQYFCVLLLLCLPESESVGLPEKLWLDLPTKKDMVYLPTTLVGWFTYKRGSTFASIFSVHEPTRSFGHSPNHSDRCSMKVINSTEPPIVGPVRYRNPIVKLSYCILIDLKYVTISS